MKPANVFKYETETNFWTGATPTSKKLVSEHKNIRREHGVMDGNGKFVDLVDDALDAIFRPVAFVPQLD